MKHTNINNYAHHRHIYFVSDRNSPLTFWCSQMLGQINHRYIKQVPASIFTQRICSRDPLDLLVLDCESIDFAQIDYFLFITMCIKPELPVVILGHVPAAREKQCRARNVLDIINCRLPVQHLKQL